MGGGGIVRATLVLSLGLGQAVPNCLTCVNSLPHFTQMYWFTPSPFTRTNEDYIHTLFNFCLVADLKTQKVRISGDQ